MKNKSGLTFVEQVVVVVMVGIVAIVAIPNLKRGVDKARANEALVQLEVLHQAVLLYKTRHGSMPSTVGCSGYPFCREPWINSTFNLNIIGEAGAMHYSFRSDAPDHYIINAHWEQAPEWAIRRSSSHPDPFCFFSFPAATPCPIPLSQPSHQPGIFVGPFLLAFLSAFSCFSTSLIVAWYGLFPKPIRKRVHVK